MELEYYLTVMNPGHQEELIGLISVEICFMTTLEYTLSGHKRNAETIREL
jgi:hypothetical protein